MNFTAITESRNSRLKRVLKEKKISQEKLGDRLGTSGQAVNERLNQEKEISDVNFIEAVAEATGYSFRWLLTGAEPKLQADVSPAENRTAHEYAEYQEAKLEVNEFFSGKNIRPVVVTVSPSNQELVTYVPVKAQAGYMKGYGDPAFIERLPAFTLPGVIKDATYRMFEVDGDSMLQLGNKGLRSGEIVIARYVEDIFDMKDNRVYVVISSEGIAIKRVINRLKDKENPCLVMCSDNKNGQHPNYLLKPKQIKEVWEAKRFISGDFSFDTNLFEILGDLQAEQAILKEKVRKLEEP